MSNKTKQTLIVNLYGGPGTGKSTTAAGVFYHLKTLGINSEMAREYAKNVVWKEAYSVLHDQLYILAKQNNILHYLEGKVDVVITDSPILLSIIYGKHETDLFRKFVLEKNKKYNNLDVYLKRVKAFESAGRMQDEDQAKGLDSDIKKMLEENNIRYETCEANEDAPRKIAAMAYSKLTGLPMLPNMIGYSRVHEGMVVSYMDTKYPHGTPAQVLIKDNDKRKFTIKFLEGVPLEKDIPFIEIPSKIRDIQEVRN